MNEDSNVDKNHPLKTKYVRNNTCLFFDDELRTIERSRRKLIERMEIPKTEAGFLIQFWSILSCLPKRKVNNSTYVSLVKISVLGILSCSNS